jgi:hypothetical protein
MFEDSELATLEKNGRGRYWIKGFAERSDKVLVAVWYGEIEVQTPKYIIKRELYTKLP